MSIRENHAPEKKTQDLAGEVEAVGVLSDLRCTRWGAGSGEGVGYLPTFFWQIFGKISLVFGCIGTDLARNTRFPAFSKSTLILQEYLQAGRWLVPGLQSQLVRSLETSWRGAVLG